MMNVSLLPPSGDINSVLQLVALLVDPVATRARVEEFNVAADEARSLIAQAEKDRAAVDAERIATTRELAAARAAHDAKLAADQYAHEQTIAQREAEIAAREQQGKELHAAAAADAKEAKRLREDLLRRIKLVSEAPEVIEAA
jgi:hypothetical protein